jgi:hypothetical protein
MVEPFGTKFNLGGAALEEMTRSRLFGHREIAAALGKKSHASGPHSTSSSARAAAACSMRNTARPPMTSASESG